MSRIPAQADGMRRRVAALRYDLGRAAAHPPRDAARIAVSRLRAQAIGVGSEARVRLRPAVVAAEDIDRMLSGGPAAVAARSLEALPVVGRFTRDVELLTADDRRRLLERATALAERRFTLLGSHVVLAGDPIDWSSDPVTGAQWPLRHAWRLRSTYPDGSDILVPWVLGWFQHLPLLAVAHRLTGDERYRLEVRAQIAEWIAHNPVELGIHWMSPMNAAMRAISWAATLALLGDRLEDDAWLRSVAGSLIAHGRFIMRHQRREPRNNHYLACVVGLLVLSVVAAGARDASRWRRFALGALEDDIALWTLSDGCANEGSISYHAFVLELLLCAAGAEPTGSWASRIAPMLRFVASYTQPSGRAPQLGDAGDWRVLPLDDYGVPPSGHLHALRRYPARLARSSGSSTFPDGGFHVLQRGETHLVVRCGGSCEDPAHIHHDQLSFELAAGRQPVIVDPGTYVYWTASRAERDRFRSTRFHAALRVGALPEAEFDPVDVARMALARRAIVTRWQPDGEDAIFEGRYPGFELLDPPATHVRTIILHAAGSSLTICDRVISSGEHDLEWTFPLAPGAVAVSHGDHVRVALPSARLVVRAHGVHLGVESGWYSSEYGVRERVAFLRARRVGRPGCDTTSFHLALQR